MRRLVKNMRGQAMVEMAIVLPILLAMVFGIIEFGNIYSHQLEVNNLARHGARTAIVAVDKSDEADRLLEDDLAELLDEDKTEVHVNRDGDNVTVAVDYDVTLITGQIIGIGTKRLSAAATMKVER